MSDEQLVEYFIQQTNEQLKAIHVKLDDIMAFKWKLTGIACACSAIVSVVIAIAYGR